MMKLPQGTLNKVFWLIMNSTYVHIFLSSSPKAGFGFDIAPSEAAVVIDSRE